jgi:hypothetical protein
VLQNPDLLLCQTIAKNGPSSWKTIFKEIKHFDKVALQNQIPGMLGGVASPSDMAWSWGWTAACWWGMGTSGYSRKPQGWVDSTHPGSIFRFPLKGCKVLTHPVPKGLCKGKKRLKF